MEESCGEDDEEEADGEDLSWTLVLTPRTEKGEMYEGERYDGLEACRHRKAEEVSSAAECL